MDSNRIKNLATGVRDALRAEASARLDAVLAEGSRERLEAAEQVRSIETDIREHGRDEVVDRAAYTWFNRLCALRFMDSNGYTPTPAVTPRAGSTQPAILADAALGVYDPEYGVSQDVQQRVAGLLTGSIASSNAAEVAYALLLGAVCSSYAESMGYLFAEDVASSLLMPQGLLAQGSILSRIVEDMDEEACSDVEVLGWLYQFYIAERKDEYFASKKKATAADIPAATQLFTPRWIVAFLTENSLGRLWMLNNQGSELAASMDYYIAPEGDQPHIEVSSADDIRVLDPACGSGHILVYAFDLLFRMYEEEGWPTEDIPQMILENNLFGLEIDRRAAEIASFALEMKARGRDPRWLEKDIDAHVHVLEPVTLLPQELELVPRLAERHGLLEAMSHLDEVGSLYVPDPLDEPVLSSELEHIEHDGSLFAESAIDKLEVMLANVKALNQNYHCVIANPPYMGSGNMNPWLSGWVKKAYPDEKGDLCTCFIERSVKYARTGGYASLVTMHSWMFLGSYEAMRQKLIGGKAIVAMAHLGARAFDAIGGEVVQTAATVFGNYRSSYPGAYARLVDLDSADGKRTALVEAICNPDCGWFYRSNTEDFKAIPGWPIAYWAKPPLYEAFEKGERLSQYAIPKQGMKTADNGTYLRLWYEVSTNKRLGLGYPLKQAITSGKKWYPYVKGGPFRRWYGNNEYVINWEKDGARLRSFPKAVLRNIQYSFRENLTWSVISSGAPAFRFTPQGSMFDGTGSCLFADNKTLLYLQGLLNSSIILSVAKVLSPTLTFEIGQIANYPVIVEDAKMPAVEKAVLSSRLLCKDDWDSFETSWDFVRHPMAYVNAEGPTRIADAYARWESECRGRFDQLRANEEELNRIFARIYRMEGEVPIEVPDDKVSVRLADRARDARSLVSYAIGCLFGRYSTEAEGLVLADQDATADDFRAKAPGSTFLPDADNVLPVLADEWFDDDVVAGVRRWLAHAYGEETLEENVAWLEGSLGRDLRSYLVKDFYADHLKVYQKRPIYWMFQSPKKSFQCLVYMHRYDEGTVGTILTGYLRPLEVKLRARLQALESPGARASDVREASRVRGQIAELEQWEREVIYPLAHERVSIDLDDGVKVNYNKFPRALAKVPGLSEWR